MFDPYYLQQLAIGLSLGMTYALMAIGFTLIFGVLNVVNFTMARSTRWVPSPGSC